MKKRNYCFKLICVLCIFSFIFSGCINRGTEESAAETLEEEKPDLKDNEKSEPDPAASKEAETETEEADLSGYFDGLNGTAVIYDTAKNKYTIYNRDQAAKRSSPCSTFKIISSLIALENGIIDPENSTREWSGEIFWNEDWNKDIDFSEAFRTSCVWYYRQVVDDIGKELMQKELDRLQYGNCDISDWEGRLNTNNSNRALTGFWIESSLQISPQEQVEVMERIFGEDSEYSEETRQELRQVMLIPETTDSDIQIYGKTGMGKLDGIVVDAWFTGFAEAPTGRIYFCVHLGRTDGMNVSSSQAKEIAIKAVSDYCAKKENDTHQEKASEDLKITAKGVPWKSDYPITGSIAMNTIRTNLLLQLLKTARPLK